MNDIVRDGYDRIASDYAEQRDQFKSEEHLARLVRLLKPAARILDVGSGCGVPIDRYFLARGFDVTGIDISPAQVALARELNPGALYEARDMLSLRAGEISVDAVVSFYAIFHAPRALHGQLLRVLRSFLRIDGPLLITMGASDWEGTDEFHGTTMFWSHFGPQMNRELVVSAGFGIELDKIDRSGGEQHQVILARAL